MFYESSHWPADQESISGQYGKDNTCWDDSLCCDCGGYGFKGCDSKKCYDDKKDDDCDSKKWCGDKKDDDCDDKKCCDSKKSCDRDGVWKPDCDCRKKCCCKKRYYCCCCTCRRCYWSC